MRGLSAAKHPGRSGAVPRHRPDSPFERAVARVVRRIPRGTTLGYGEVALRAGKPGAARLVVRALNRLDEIPWWRVARKDGTLAPLVSFEQEQLLRAERWRGPPGAARTAGARGGTSRGGTSRAGASRGGARAEPARTSHPTRGPRAGRTRAGRA